MSTMPTATAAATLDPCLVARAATCQGQAREPSAEGAGRAPWVACALALLCAVACGGRGKHGPASRTAGDGVAPGRPVFSERAAETGLDFVHFNGMSGEYYYSEVMGAGAALFDYDRDGDLDVYLVQGRMIGPGKTFEDATFPPPEKPLIDRLFQNDLVVHPDGRRELSFTDVTEESGIVSPGYGMGVAVGDYDGDGWPDLYVMNWAGPNQLFRNNGDRTFSDATAAAGVGDTRWSIDAAFIDYDEDGDLDLFVLNYLDYSYAVNKECANEIGLRDYCAPSAYHAVPDDLFRNRGDGTFENVSEVAGLTSVAGGGMGLCTGDFDGDGWLDIYVANDESANQLWMNQRDGTFRDEALVAGAAVNAEGRAEAGMGVGVADFDADGDEDILIVHIGKETDTLYVNDGTALFVDRTTVSGLAMASWEYTSFAPVFLDFDNDGWVDIFIANGGVNAVRSQLLAGEPYPLRMKNQLFRNLGSGSFREISDEAGPALQLEEVSRAAAPGDIDNDGDTDIVMQNNAGPVRLLINEVGQDAHWLGLRLVGGEKAPRDMLGAYVELLRRGLPTQGRRVRTEGSYESSPDPRVLFGLGDSPDYERIRVTWPDGAQEEWTQVPTGQYTTLRQGTAGGG